MPGIQTKSTYYRHIKLKAIISSFSPGSTGGYFKDGKHAIYIALSPLFSNSTSHPNSLDMVLHLLCMFSLLSLLLMK